MSKAGQKNVAGFAATLNAGLKTRGGGAQLPAQAAQAATVDLTSEQHLQDLERRIEQSVATYQGTVKQAQQRHQYELGQLLMEIRDGGYYSAAGYKKFGHYVTGRWGWKRAHVYRLIDLAAVRRALLPLGDVADSVPEGQAREIAPVVRYHGDDQARGLWREIQQRADDGQRVTAAVVREVRAELRLDIPADGVSPIGDSEADSEIIDAEIVNGDAVAELVNADIKAAADAAEKAVRRLTEALARQAAPFDYKEAAVDLSRVRSATVRLERLAADVPGLPAE